MGDMSKRKVIRINLRCGDGSTVIVAKQLAAAMSGTIRRLIAGHKTATFVELPAVRSEILFRVIDWAKEHRSELALQWPNSLKSSTEGDAHHDADAAGIGRPIDLSPWERNLLGADHTVLYDVICAARYLDMPRLQSVACQRVAELIKELRTPDEICRVFYGRKGNGETAMVPEDRRRRSLTNDDAITHKRMRCADGEAYAG